MYQVVEFQETNDVAVISAKWLSDDGKCAFWPTIFKMSSKITSALVKHQSPGENWESCSIKRVMYKTDDFSKAQEKAKLAEEESDLQTDVEQTLKVAKRQKRPNPKFISESETEDSESDETDYPVPPPKITLHPKFTTASDPNPSSSTKPCASTKPSSSMNPSSSTKPCASTKPSSSSYKSTPKPQSESPSTASTTAITHRPVFTSPSSSSISNSQPSMSSPKRKTLAGSHGINLLSERDISIFRSLEEIKSEIREQGRKISAIMQKLDAGTKDVVTDLPDGLSLPASSLEDMDSIELALSDPAVMKLTVNYLAGIGGSIIKTMTKRLMSTAMENQVAVLYNWTGAKNKRPFGTMKICCAIQKAVKKNFLSASSSEVEFYIKDWLRNAKDRDGGRKKRMRVAVAAEGSD